MYLGVDVGGTNIAAGLTDDAGKLICQAECAVDRAVGAEALCAQIVALCRQAARAGGVEVTRVNAVGVGFPGQVDDGAGTVVYTPNMPFRDTPFRALFQRELPLKVRLGNDGNCAAAGEYWAGAAKGCDPAVVVTLGTGIGGGMVTGGRLFTGFGGCAMEVGHIRTRAGGELCRCGNRGCWETYGSATALIRMTREEMETDRASVLWALCGGDMNRVEGRTPFEGAKRGDATSRRALERYLDGLSEGIISLINILQPEVICLGGGVSNASDALLLEPLRERVSAGVFDRRNPTRIVHAALGNDAGIVGAAMLCRM